MHKYILHGGRGVVSTWTEVPYGAEMAAAEVGGVEKKYIMRLWTNCLNIGRIVIQKGQSDRKVNGSSEAEKAGAKVNGIEMVGA